MALAPSFRPGERIFLPGASGEPTALAPSVLSAKNVHVTTSFVPGVNPLTSGMIGAGTTVTGLFMQAALAEAQREGSFRHLPMSYAATIKYLNEAPPFDTCVVQVAPPDAYGQYSLGPSAEFTPIVLRRARRIIAVVNENVPRITHAPFIARKDCAQIFEADTPLAGYDVGVPDAAAQAVARLVAGFVPDGAAIQLGLGKVPHAILHALIARSSVRLHSGMLSDGVMALAEAGALDPDWNHVTTVVLGSPALYRWVAGRTDIHVRGVEFTHDPAVLAGIAPFIAVNSALEVDLFGQCNLELASGRAISGPGGAPDFAHAARLSRGGISIVALLASFGRGGSSRIRPWLGHGGMVSLGRTEVDVVVTEHGAADLRGLSVQERAAALIGIAAPSERAELHDHWQEITVAL